MKRDLEILFMMMTMLFLQALTASNGESPIVSLPKGRVQGLQLQTNDSKVYYAFKGMRYAQPPLGNLRFQAPLPPDPWDGVWNATKEGGACFPTIGQRYYPNPTNLSEDCLYLNVYTPDLNASAKLTVMFWVFGGGYNGGNGDQKYFGPEYLIQHDVVVVTINHRLGPFGMLSTGDTVIPGNAALKDQVIALKWVQENILYFGGDPEKVTIFGESSGGQSVGLHILSKKSKGLFRGVICQSGCTITNMGFNSFPKTLIYEVAKNIDPSISEKNSSEEIRDLLLSQTASALINASSVVEKSFGPTVEAKSESSFLDRPYYEILSEGNFNNVSFMVGFTSLEALSFIEKNAVNETANSYDENITSLLPRNLFYKEGSNLTEIATIIKNAYVGGNGTFTKQPEKALEYYSDNISVKSSYKVAEIASKFIPNVYLYQFSFYGTVSKKHNNYTIEGGGKAGHFDDVPYLWNMPLFALETDEDRLAAKKFTKLWTNFAKYLNPTPEADPLLGNVKWETVTPTNLSFLDIGENLTMRANHKVKENAAWNQVFLNYSRVIVTF